MFKIELRVSGVHNNSSHSTREPLQKKIEIPKALAGLSIIQRLWIFLNNSVSYLFKRNFHRPKHYGPSIETSLWAGDVTDTSPLDSRSRLYAWEAAAIGWVLMSRESNRWHQFNKNVNHVYVLKCGYVDECLYSLQTKGRHGNAKEAFGGNSAIFISSPSLLVSNMIYKQFRLQHMPGVWIMIW